MSKVEEDNPIGYIFRRETLGFTPGLRHLVDRKWSKKNLLFRKNIFAHYGCVNAIDFSQDGNHLVSGGDDRRILLWNVGKAIHSGKEEPACMNAEHGSNVFALAIDSGNKKIFSAGNDDQVIMHDMGTGTPLDYFLHEQPVYGVSIDPLNDNIFASACDDGKLFIYDTRASTEPTCLASSSSAFHAVMFHPLEPRLIVSGNSKEGVALWDVRKPKIPLLRYGGLNADQCCMSVRFNGDGSKIVALRRRLPPVLYDTKYSAHLFQFNHSGYYNSCTMKSASFAGTNDEYVLSGSDNFDLYMWKIPPAGSNRWVDEAHLVLKGHRSIVNQVRYNKQYNVIISSGVEKIIKIWSPFPMSSGRMSGQFSMHEKERKIFSHTQYINLVTQSGQLMSLSFDTTRKSTREDPRMMAFFDALVQRDIEGWSDDSDNIAENSYAVVSQAESSSSDDNGSQSESTPRTTTSTSSSGTTTTSTSQQQVDTVNQSLVGDEELPDFERGEYIFTQRELPDDDVTVEFPEESTQSMDQQLSTDEDDPFKNFVNSEIPPVVNRNIIKELISKKHQRLCELAKAHVILESNIRKPSKKRQGRNYRTRSSSGRESDAKKMKAKTRSSSSSDHGGDENKLTGHCYRSQKRRPSTSPTSSSRHLNKKKMFKSFKGLRYERKTPGSKSSSGSGSICSFYCQSQGRYQHNNLRNGTTNSSSSNDENNQPCTSATARSKNTTTTTSRSSSSSSSSSSSTSSSSSSSDSDSSKKFRKTTTTKPCLKTSSIIDNIDDNDSDMENIESSIKNSPAFKLSPLIRRIEMERLRKIRHARENQTKNSKLDSQNNKRTWSDLSSSSSSSSSSTSSSSSEDEESHRNPKRRFKYLNPNYTNFSSSGHDNYYKTEETTVVLDARSTLVDSGIDVDNCRGDNNNLNDELSSSHEPCNCSSGGSSVLETDQKFEPIPGQESDKIHESSTKTTKAPPHSLLMNNCTDSIQESKYSSPPPSPSHK